MYEWIIVWLGVGVLSVLSILFCKIWKQRLEDRYASDVVAGRQADREAMGPIERAQIRAYEEWMRLQRITDNPDEYNAAHRASAASFPSQRIGAFNIPIHRDLCDRLVVEGDEIQFVLPGVSGVRFRRVRASEVAELTDQPKVRLPTLPDDTQVGENDKVHACVICLENKKTHAASGCGHMILCNSCTVEQNGKLSACPVCRKPCPSLLRVFE